MRIVRDNREQRPFTFTGKRYQGVEVIDGALSIGDYSLVGLTDKVAVERKELGDLVQCLGRERERFERELQRGAALDALCVIIEASFEDLAKGRYRSQLNPHAACQSVLAFSGRYRVPFLFAGSRAAAEYATWGFLRQYLEGARRRWASIVKAHDEQDVSGGDAA